jgi:hypothetical protein
MQYVNLNRPLCPDPDVVSWLEANGIDPSATPAAQYVQIAGGRINYLEFTVGEDGHKQPVLDEQGEVCAWQKHWVSRPLLSAPENHNLGA